MARGICELRRQIEEQTGKPVEIRSFREDGLSHGDVEKTLDRAMKESLMEKTRRMNTKRTLMLAINVIVALVVLAMLVLFIIF